MQAKDRQKKKGATKGIRIDENGDACFEDVAKFESQVDFDDSFPEPEKTASISKKVWNRYFIFSVLLFVKMARCRSGCVTGQNGFCLTRTHSLVNIFKRIYKCYV